MEMKHIETNAPVKRTVINIASAVQQTIGAALSGNKVVLLSVMLVAAGAVTITFQSDNTGLTGAMTLAAGQAIELSAERYGIMETATGEGLKFTLSGAVQVSGNATWIYMTA